MATLTRIRGGDLRGRARDIYYCLQPACSVLSYSRGEFERHLASHKSRDKTEHVEEEFNFGEENVEDDGKNSDLNDNSSFTVTVNVNPDHIFLDGVKKNLSVIKPEKDGNKPNDNGNIATPLIKDYVKPQMGPRVKVETRGRKSLDQTKSVVGPQKCNICDATFNCSITLGTHMFKVHHIGGEVCGLCQKVCSTQVALKAHIISYHTSESVACSTCGIIFAGKHKLKAHELNTHGQANLPCSTCGKTFPTKYRLKAHEVTYHSEPSFKCDSCPKMVKTKYLLAEHSLIHKEPSFLCTDCPEAFRTKSSLDKHQYICHGASVEIFKCDKCDKELFSKERLRDHARDHREANVKCKQCEKVLSSVRALNSHTKAVHEKIKRFSCNLCEYKAFKKDKFEKHVQKVHSNVMETCLFCKVEVKHAYHHVTTKHKDIPNAWEIHKKKQQSIKTEKIVKTE